MAKRPRITTITCVSEPVILYGKTLTTPPRKPRKHEAIIADAVAAGLSVDRVINTELLTKEEKYARLDRILFKG
jgi:hypothetical protein